VIVAALASCWGLHPIPGGKAVYAVFETGGDRSVNTEHAMEIPPSALAGLQVYAAQRRSAVQLAKVEALLDQDGPLSEAERQALGQALRWWRGQQVAAAGHVGEIAARLCRP
jgi:hypothetical protein